MNKVSNHSEDTVEYKEGAATVTVTRLDRATPPLNGTFDVEIYGGRAEGIVYVTGCRATLGDLHNSCNCC